MFLNKLRKNRKIFFLPVTLEYPHPFYCRINETRSVLQNRTESREARIETDFV